MITVEPDASAFTVPDVEPIEATDVLLLLHVPPLVALVRVVADPAQMVSDPPITAGCGSTVMLFVVVQPVGRAKVMVVVPSVTPVMSPVVLLALAMALLALLHVPLPALVKVVVAFTHTVDAPEIALGSGFTVTCAFTVATPQLLLMV